MADRRLTSTGAYSVTVIDMYHYDPAEDIRISGFPTLELATEYARRRTRDSLEELRGAGKSQEALRKEWYLFGEDCIVSGDGGFTGASEIDYFIAHPATADERDWLAIEKLVAGGAT